MVEWSACPTRNQAVPGSSPALTTTWSCYCYSWSLSSSSSLSLLLFAKLLIKIYTTLLTLLALLTTPYYIYVICRLGGPYSEKL